MSEQDPETDDLDEFIEEQLAIDPEFRQYWLRERDPGPEASR